MSKFSELDILELRYSLMYDDQVNQAQAADEWGTTQANVSSIARGNTWKHVGGPIRGEDYSSNYGAGRVLSDKEAKQARIDYNNNKSYAAIGKKYGVSSAAIQAIVQGKTYREVGGPICESRPVGKSTRKFNPREVVSIRERYAKGNYTFQDLAKAEGCHKNTIKRIIRGESYSECGGTILQGAKDRRRDLSEESIEEIRNTYKTEDTSIVAMAEEYGTSRRGLRRIVTGVTYVDCPGPIKGEDY